MAKRDREHLIQGWFDPEDPNDNAVIQIYNRARKEYKKANQQELTNKQFITHAALWLGDQFYPDLIASLPTSDTQLRDQIVRERQAAEDATKRSRRAAKRVNEVVDRLVEIVESGRLGGVGSGKIGESTASPDEVLDDPIRQSIAGMLTSLKFDDMDDED